MIDGYLFPLTVVAAVGCGIVAGLFFAFSVMVVGSLIDWDDASPYLLAGGLLSLVGVYALTGGYHIPRNEALDRLEPSAADAAGHWTRYVREWTTWNHVRGVAALAAAALFTIALHVR